MLDLALRSGPYGDDFGRSVAGLTLDKVQDTRGGIDLARAWAELDRAAEPLVVIGRRDVRSNNSWMHNLPLLAKGPFRGSVLVHPQDAKGLGVEEGGRARLTGAGGSVVVTVARSDTLRPGVLSLPHGWGHDAPRAGLALAAERPGANLNAVLDDSARDPGAAVARGLRPYWMIRRVVNFT